MIPSVLGPLFINLANMVVGFVRRSPIGALCIALAMLSAWLWLSRNHALALAEDRRVQAVDWHFQFVAQKSEMTRLVALIAAARADAARQDRANIERVQQAWSNNLQEVTHDYQADLAVARAGAERLRASPGTRANGAAGGGAGAGLPTLSALSGGAVRPGGSAVVDAADIDACTVNSVRLIHLIAAWGRAASIDVNGQR